MEDNRYGSQITTGAARTLLKFAEAELLQFKDGNKAVTASSTLECGAGERIITQIQTETIGEASRIN